MTCSHAMYYYWTEVMLWAQGCFVLGILIGFSIAKRKGPEKPVL